MRKWCLLASLFNENLTADMWRKDFVAKMLTQYVWHNRDIRPAVFRKMVFAVNNFAFTPAAVWIVNYILIVLTVFAIVTDHSSDERAVYTLAAVLERKIVKRSTQVEQLVNMAWVSPAILLLFQLKLKGFLRPKGHSQLWLWFWCNNFKISSLKIVRSAFFFSFSLIIMYVRYFVNLINYLPRAI